MWEKFRDCMVYTVCTHIFIHQLFAFCVHLCAQQESGSKKRKKERKKCKAPHGHSYFDALYYSPRKRSGSNTCKHTHTHE